MPTSGGRALDTAGEVGEDAGDGTAFADWVRPHLSALSAFAVRQVGRDDAADVVQDALVRAWRRWGTYRAERGSPRAWLIAIVLDQARRHRLRHLRRAPSGDEPQSSEHESVTGDRLDIDAAIATLSRRQREVVVLFYLADLSVTEIAEVLDVGAGSVKSHLHTARERLRSILEEP